MSQLAYFPMKYLNVTQAYGANTYTHKQGYAIDIAGKDAGIDTAHAPFDCKVTKSYAPGNWSLGHTVWFTSINKVKYADGTVDYATISMTHDNSVADLPVGKTFKQGAKIYDEGTAGHATGNHIHLECAKGKTANWTQIGREWVIVNRYKPQLMLTLRSTTIVRNYGGLTWKKEVTMYKGKSAKYWHDRWVAASRLYRLRHAIISKVKSLVK